VGNFSDQVWGDSGDRPHGQCWRNIHDGFASSNHRLSKESTKPCSRFDGPHRLDVEPLRPRQQPLGLMPVGGKSKSRDLVFVAVNGDGGVGRLCGSIPIVTGMNVPPNLKTIITARVNISRRPTDVSAMPHQPPRDA
jgi:hypothetical protein